MPVGLIEVSAVGRSDTGVIRQHNEDSFLIDQQTGLFIVADGMGGELAGEVASDMAVKLIHETVQGEWVYDVSPDFAYEQFPSKAGQLVAGVRLANRRIYQESVSNPDCRNMGTTVVAALVCRDTVVIAHVGDSRGYLLRYGVICQLTDDHSLVAEQVRAGLLSIEQAEISPQRNIITRALGACEDVEVDLCQVKMMPGDCFLLCSDGLTNMLSDELLASIIGTDQDLEKICTTLIESANANGGRDNVTVVLIACT